MLTRQPQNNDTTRPLIYFDNEALASRKPCQRNNNLGRRFGTSKMHFSPPPPPLVKAAVRSKAVILVLLTFCLLLLPLWESVIALCFVERYFMSILELQSS